ncbi:MAG: proline racemase family protein, partial [Synergistaceae bacterium]|nr:proline racemase family protein [Synergistaceae bacterium]
MRFSRMITCVDAHTAGEPVRIVTSGFPAIKGSSMLEKREYVLDNLDYCRKLERVHANHGINNHCKIYKPTKHHIQFIIAREDFPKSLQT